MLYSSSDPIAAGWYVIWRDGVWVAWLHERKRVSLLTLPLPFWSGPACFPSVLWAILVTKGKDVPLGGDDLCVEFCCILNIWQFILFSTPVETSDPMIFYMIMHVLSMFRLNFLFYF